MSLILIVSIIIRLAAIGWSIVLLRRIRDWRIGLMTAMFGMMALRQILTLLTVKESWAISFKAQLIELPGLAVSAIALLVVIFLGRLICRAVEDRERVIERELMFQSLIERAPFSIWICDGEGTVVFSNQAALSLFGMTDPTQIIGRYNIYRDMTEAEKPFLDCFERAWAGEVVRYRQDLDMTTVKYDTTSRETIHFYSTLFAIPGGRGRRSNIVVVQENVTEEVRAKEQILRQNAKLEAINKVFQEAVTCEAEEEVARVCLTVAQELTGSKFGFVGEVNQAGRFDTIALSDPGWDACRIPRSNATMFIKDMEIRGIWGTVLKHGKSLIVNDPSSHPNRVGTPEGHPPLTSFLGVPLKRADKTVGMIALANKESGYDFTDREAVETLSVTFVEALMHKRTEEALRKAHNDMEAKVAERTDKLARANIQLKEMDRLKSEFLATMSHELRTPLNSIIGFTGILLQGIPGEINEEQRKQLSMVYSSGKHLLGLINDVLDLSRIESGKMEVSIEKFKIQDVVSEVHESLSPMISQKGLRLVTEIPEETPEILSDRKKVFQILLNLVTNAVKFAKTGEVRIECKFDNDNLETRVSDTGIGIKKENMNMLFDAFRQVNGTAQRRYEGAGLGLYLCRKLVTLLGGKIWAESEYGKGSMFTFTLPLEPKERKIT